MLHAFQILAQLLRQITLWIFEQAGNYTTLIQDTLRWNRRYLEWIRNTLRFLQHHLLVYHETCIKLTIRQVSNEMIHLSKFYPLFAIFATRFQYPGLIIWVITSRSVSKFLLSSFFFFFTSEFTTSSVSESKISTVNSKRRKIRGLRKGTNFGISSPTCFSPRLFSRSILICFHSEKSTFKLLLNRIILNLFFWFLWKDCY